MRIDGDVAELDEAERVAIRLGLGDRLRADVAAGAGAVLDHEALAQRLVQIVGRNARRHVHQAAGGGDDNQTNGLGRIILGSRRDRDVEACRSHSRDNAQTEANHFMTVLPFLYSPLTPSFCSSGPQ